MDIQKGAVLMLLALLMSLTASAQVGSQVSVSQGIYQKVDVKPYAGLPYRLSARIKVDTVQSNKAHAWLLASVKRTDKRSGSFEYMRDNAVANKWRTYSVAGKLDKQADSITVFAGYYMNGKFSLDDFKLEVARSKDDWQTVPLVNATFEDPTPLTATGLPVGWQQSAPVPAFTRQLGTEPSGNHFLAVQGRGIIHYGRNPKAGQYATVNGVKLYYEAYGQGEPLLLLHGNGESISSFMNQIEALAKEYRVIAVDTRDQGQSGHTSGKLTYDLFADDMHALLDKLGLPAAHIVGWSDGGNTGLSMALRYPQQVRSLVTMGANLYADTTSIDAKMLKEVRQMYYLSALVAPFSSKFKRAHRLTAMLLHYPQLTPTQLHAIKAPVLVLAGEKDIIKEAHTRLLAESIPGAQVVILPKVSHYAPQENPALFNETVLRFLHATAEKNAPKQMDAKP
ncbi:alpha/beta hydrolase [Hymenobacter tibetensis]|uniref:Alpha/beta hydrolase n=1 Tax=Hymenobacter tibetensis TaxID=497967 RepID=A0ABY4CVY3_9BACT|nr:alpha/beta hydrolase [Hymenobacter tibetensis]UOG74433.1 alpha/beta hydrolase [Hymenobacter tibetensis]